MKQVIYLQLLSRVYAFTQARHCVKCAGEQHVHKSAGVCLLPEMRAGMWHAERHVAAVSRALTLALRLP